MHLSLPSANATVPNNTNNNKHNIVDGAVITIILYGCERSLMFI